MQEAIHEEERNEFWQGTHEGRILGNDDFAEMALRSAEGKPGGGVTVDHVIAAVCRHYGMSEAELASPGKVRRMGEARAAAALLVRDLPGVSLAALATRLGRDVSALSRAARLHANRPKGSSFAAVHAAIAGNEDEMSKCQN